MTAGRPHRLLHHVARRPRRGEVADAADPADRNAQHGAAVRRPPERDGDARQPHVAAPA